MRGSRVCEQLWLSSTATGSVAPSSYYDINALVSGGVYLPIIIIVNPITIIIIIVIIIIMMFNNCTATIAMHIAIQHYSKNR